GEGEGMGKGMGVGRVEERLVEVMEGLVDVRWEWRGSVSMGVGFAGGNVWGRKARRRRGREEAAEKGDVEGESEGEGEGEGVGEMALGFKVQLLMGKGGGSEVEGVEVKVRWLQGVDSVLFESFCGMLRREMLKGCR
ncbi:hypothetical protein Q9189_007933, partial [Teloschistes chrysophthalmus]